MENFQLVHWVETNSQLQVPATSSVSENLRYGPITQEARNR